MKRTIISLSLLAAVAAISACKPTSFYTEGDTFRGISVVAEPDLYGDTVLRVPPATASFSGNPEADPRTITFNDGPLAGRTIEFDKTDAVTSGVNPGETAFVEDLNAVGNMGYAYLVGLTDAAGKQSLYALYTLNEDLDNAPVRTASYRGTMIGEGFSPLGTGRADGSFSIFANFDANKIIGTMDNIQFRNGGGAFPTIRFTADLQPAEGNAEYFADTIDIDGAPGDAGHLEGVITFVTTPMGDDGATTGAFSVTAGTPGASTNYGMTGIFNGDYEDGTAGK